ncbi:MAG TPA: hypothetical protein VKR58_15140 [Aquella sp.]|nr:hypothetical protein [Aquella sp.]
MKDHKPELIDASPFTNELEKKFLEWIAYQDEEISMLNECNEDN